MKGQHMTDKLTAEQYRKMAQGKRDEAQRLIDQYGQGVRPSWVSTDLALAYEAARRYDNTATTLEMHPEEQNT
jgi:hypothetical protein